MPLASGREVLVLSVLLALLVVGGLVQLMLAVRTARAVPPLSVLPPAARASWPRLTMVVPARDEEAGVEAALRSKLACGYPQLELVAVDDRSRDRTGALLDAVAARDARVRVVHLESLPDGWLGKLHALAQGTAAATGDWVLFSDADVHLAPGVLERLVDHAEREQIDLVAVFPQMHQVGLGLDALVACMARPLFLGARVWRANDDRSSLGLGVGAFNLVRREVLASTRALERLKLEIGDDVGLGAVVKHAGYRCRLYVGREQVHLTFLPTLGAALRSAAKGGGMLGWGVALPVVVALAPVLVELVLPLWGLAVGGWPRVLGASAWAVTTAVNVTLVRHVRGPLRGAWLWPIGQLLSAWLVWHSGWRAWREQGVWWRDTFYSRAALTAGRCVRVPSGRVIDGWAAGQRAQG